MTEVKRTRRVWGKPHDDPVTSFGKFREFMHALLLLVHLLDHLR